ncbi:MAG: FtsQ-type POTRA domain-containing protein [Pseudomonadales bacterium]|nr:FtsQ-type POTRA domain-containing protein [Pseudomonadales bacterium]
MMAFIGFKKQSKQSSKKPHAPHSAMNPVYSAPSAKEWEKQRKKNLKRLQQEKVVNKKRAGETGESFFQQLQSVFRAFLIFGFCLIAVFIGYQTILISTDVFKQEIHAVDVNGSFNYVDKKLVIKAVNQAVSNGNIDYNLQLLHDSLMANPWVKSVSIRRRINHRLVIDIQEYKPIAFLNDSSLIAADTTVFKPSEMPNQLLMPTLYSDQHIEAVELYQQLSELLPQELLPIRSLNTLTESFFTVNAVNGLELKFEKHDWPAQLKRFNTIYHKNLYAKANDVKTVDLRYQNGAAVSFKTEDIVQLD